MKKILFTGGGSAGHAVPNLALMHELRYSHLLLYMGTGGIEKTLVTRLGFPFFEVETPKLVRKFCLQNFKIPARLSRAKKQALLILQKEKPDLVFSKGGFVSYPAVWAARKLKIPVLTHESDLSAGLCTKLIAKKCERVLTSFPETAKCFRNGVYTGSPIRREVLAGERMRARKKYGFEGEKPVLLSLGGGSGSKKLNSALQEHLPRIMQTFRILHLCGKDGAIAPDQADYVAREFESDMGSAYACADLVLSRAGSNTLFELMALKKPAVAVPLSSSGRGDQIENALYFERRGLIRTLQETELSQLPDALLSAFHDDALRASLAACEIMDGTPAVLAQIQQLLG